MIARAAVAAIATAGLLAACGADAPSTPAETAEAYFRAIKDGDGAAACALLAGAALRGTAAAGENAGTECATGSSGLAGGAIDGVSAQARQESGDTAAVLVTLDVAGQQPSKIAVGLVRDRERWKIVSFGVASTG